MKLEDVKTKKDLKAFIEFCKENYGGYLKVSLRDDAGTEGVWAVAASAADRAIYESDTSRGEKFKVFLCNYPLGGWFKRKWGCPVIAVTHGANRPTAVEKDQADIDEEVLQVNNLFEDH